MSLIHWLPLINNINDLAGGATTKAAPNVALPVHGTASKFGSGYTFSNSGIQVNNIQLTGTMTFALWIKLNTHTSCHILDLRKDPAGSSTETGYQPLYYNTSSGIQIYGSAGGSKYISCSLGTDWHHLTVVLVNGVASLYCDGAYKGETPLTAIVNVVHATIGCRVTGANPCPGIIQDVRIYNHALSKAEIKELVRTKVLHYTFDDGYAEPTTNLLPSSLQNKYVENVADAASYTITSGLTASAYTLSANIKRHIGDQSPSPYVSLNVTYSDGTKDSLTTYIATDGYNIRGTADGQFHYYKLTVLNPDKKTVTQVNGWILDRGGYTSGTPRYMTVQNAQLEAKDHATPYTPTSREGVLANEAGYYCSNGANDVEFTEVSRIGQRAIYCKDGLQRISATVPYLASDVLSTSIWFKTKGSPSANNLTAPKNGYHILLAVDSGRVEISVPTAGQLRFGGYNKTASNRFCSNFTATILDGNWHLINTVFDGLTWKGYVDGVLKGTISVTETKGDSPIVYNGKKLTIGRYYDDATSNYGATDAYIDDVRIYNTVLTESDIKDIYNIGMYVTKDGDFITNKFIECSGGNMVAASDWLQEGIQDANGISAGEMTNRLATKYIPVLPSTEYYYATNSGINVRAAHYYTKDLTWIRSDQPTKNSFTAVTPSNCSYVRFVIQYSNASNNIPIADINTYGATMRPARFNEQLPLPIKAEAKASKNCVFTCLDVCEGHSPQFLSNGKATARQIIEN